MTVVKPRIAIPSPNSDAKYSARTFPEYASAVERAGGEAVEIPLALSISEIAQLVKTCDGVLLPGSPADVDPQKYNAPRHEKTAAADPARDNVDELVLQDAHNVRKPLLGICYGLQSLNVWRQGTLKQHIESVVVHTGPKSKKIRHEIEIQPATRLGRIVADAIKTIEPDPFTIKVNSSHHQSVQTAGDGLKVVARSPKDGIIEAVEGTNPEHWVVAVQWHPERTFDEDEPSKALFRALVHEAKKWHEHMRQVATDFETAR